MSNASPLALRTAAARRLVTTVKTVPQTAEITPRWLLRMLPWVELDAGTYRVNRKPKEAAIALAAGHTGEPDLPGTFADYERAPREYELSLAQTVLRVHTRVGDLYREPMDQVEQQLRLTVEALAERQEHELVNHPEFGLLHAVDPRQRLAPLTGPPTPDDLDRLLARRRRSQFFLAHPRTIAAFGRECTRRGVYPRPVTVDGHRMPAWRGVPLLACDKLPITSDHTSSVLVLRTGEAHQGVVGLRPASLPDQHAPGISVRHCGLDSKGIASYLVTAYFSAAVLVPDALGVLENAAIAGRLPSTATEET